MMNQPYRLILKLGLLLIIIGHVHTQSYDDFTWVKRFAVVGDSYTAGIGAGGVIDTECSRYDGSWAVLMSQRFSAMQKMYNYACSGDKTPEILEQIRRLPGDLDVAVMTAGGNDLCLSALLTHCVISNVASQQGCDQVIQLAQSGLDTYFEENVRTLIAELVPKMRPNGIIVVLSYAQFFDANTDHCTGEDWTLVSPRSLPLSRGLRATMNDLVRQTNAAISSAVERTASGTSVKIGFANWDAWPAVVRGRFCEEGQSPDPFGGSATTANLQFFKINTNVVPDPWFSKKKRSIGERVEEVNDGDEVYLEMRRRMVADDLIAFVANETARTALPINSRAITQPNCPAARNGIPNFIGKLFHPTPLGHATMMTYGLNEIRSLRAEQLGLPPPGCQSDKPTCVGLPTTLKPYASWFAVKDRIVPFCNSVGQAIVQGQGGTPFSKLEDSYSSTPDKVRLSAVYEHSTRPISDSWKTDECVVAFKKMTLQCWMDNRPVANPMMLVFGGSFRVKDWTYSVIPLGTGRLWPPASRERAEVQGSLKSGTTVSTYTIKGAGFATWDRGQKTLLGNFTYCNGGNAPTAWGFKYLTPPVNGYEWEALVQIADSAHTDCMSTGWVIHYSGGPSNVAVAWQQQPNSYDLVCPGVNVGTLTCYANCCGYLPCRAWCNANCGGLICH